MNTLEHSRDMKLDEFDEISIPYAYNAYEPMNPNIIKDFNRIAMRSAFVKGTDLTKLGQKDSKFLLRDQAAPDKLLDVAGVTPARLDNIWARTPVIIGNKLIFV